eukprot:gene6768-13714_t
MIPINKIIAIEAPISDPTGTPTGRPSARPLVTPRPTTSTPTTYFYGDKVLSGYFKTDRNEGDHCRPSQLEVGIEFNVMLYRRQAIAIETPGLTSSSCQAIDDGHNIYPLTISNSSQFTAKFFEASSETGATYNTSYIRLVAKENLFPNQLYIIKIDRMNGIKHACIPYTNWLVKLKKTDNLGAYFTSWTSNSSSQSPGHWQPLYNYETIGNISFTSFVPKTCYQYNSSLDFFPRYPLSPIHVNFTLQLSFPISFGDNITLFLPGFTSGGDFSRGIAGKAIYNNTELAIASTTNSTFTALWEEGSRGLRYSDSKVVIYPQKLLRPGALFYVLIPRSVGLSTICSSPKNFSGFRYTVQTHTYRPYTTTSPGCDIHNGCSNNGICDYCTSTCICNDNYGSPSDKLKIGSPSDLSGDCSGRHRVSYVRWESPSRLPPNPRSISPEVDPTPPQACIAEENAPVWGCVTEHRASVSASMAMSVEPVNAALVPAILAQPVPDMDCATPCQLPDISTALPLRVSVTGDSNYYQKHATAVTWDSDKLSACVCDSSWEVGLGVNQTQLAEFFGPACEFRRCPSGDDPTTSSIDETDCYNKSMSTGGGLGLYGNKCHIDCSGRGLCDHKTGRCECFKGHFGPNCGMFHN